MEKKKKNCGFWDLFPLGFIFKRGLEEFEISPGGRPPGGFFSWGIVFLKPKVFWSFEGFQKVFFFREKNEGWVFVSPFVFRGPPPLSVRGALLPFSEPCRGGVGWTQPPQTSPPGSPIAPLGGGLGARGCFCLKN